MKKLILSFLAVAISIAAFAQGTEEKRTTNKKVVISQPITSLVINDDVPVILINETSNEIFVEGKPKLVDGISIENRGGELVISSSHFISKKQVAVYVDARYLKNITINGSSLVGSFETLSNSQLDVLINGSCNLMIKSAGKINIKVTEDYSFTYKATKIKETNR